MGTNNPAQPHLPPLQHKRRPPEASRASHRQQPLRQGAHHPGRDALWPAEAAGRGKPGKLFVQRLAAQGHQRGLLLWRHLSGQQRERVHHCVKQVFTSILGRPPVKKVL